MEGRLKIVNEVSKEQENLGISESIEDLSGFIDEHPECCSLLHMAIFKMDGDTTKC